MILNQVWDDILLVFRAEHLVGENLHTAAPLWSCRKRRDLVWGAKEQKWGACEEKWSYIFLLSSPHIMLPQLQGSEISCRTSPKSNSPSPVQKYNILMMNVNCRERKNWQNAICLVPNRLSWRNPKKYKRYYEATVNISYLGFQIEIKNVR